MKLWYRIVVSVYWIDDKKLYKEIQDHPGSLLSGPFLTANQSRIPSRKKKKLIAKCLEILEMQTCFITVPPRRRPLGSVNNVIIYRKVKNERK